MTTPIPPLDSQDNSPTPPVISPINLALLLNPKLVTGLFLLGLLLVVAAVVIYVRMAPPTVTSLPQVTITPPASLSELAEQYPHLAHILNDPELDSAYKEFLIAYEEGGEEAAIALADQRGMLTPDGDVAITLILDTEETDPLLAQLEAVGAIIVAVHQNQINVAVPIALIEQELQRGDGGGIFAQLTELTHVISVELPERRKQDGNLIPGEGVEVIGADVWHQAGFDGSGLRIGILALGFANYESLLGEELPDQVTIQTFGWYEEEEVHGTACAEIIHEVAPGAELILAWYDGSDAAMGEAVDWLLSQGVNIISHSASGLIGPRDGTEWDAQLVDTLASQGVLWVNSSGNEALSHYRGLFTDEDGDSLHEFAPGDELLPLYNYGHIQVALIWEDDWERAALDYELFLYDADGNELASSQDTQSGELGQEPVEWIEYDANGETVYAVVSAYDAERTVTLDIFVNGADVGYPLPAYSVCPPADAVGSLTVGAVNWDDDTLADYSSQGPTADGRLKPEISAPTGVSGATYGRHEFHGTSSSCPHVAAAAALVWQAYPQFSRQELVEFLTTQAIDLGPSGPDTGYGYGRLRLPSPPASAPSPRPTATPFPATGGPIMTSIPLPTPTSVVYVTPEPVTPPVPPAAGAGVGLIALTGATIMAGGLCCIGSGLLLLGVIGMVMLRRRKRQTPPIRRTGPPSPPPPPPVPQRRPSPSPPSAPAVADQPGEPALRCTICGASLRPESRFCPTCGQPVVTTCPYCGATLRAGARFCPRCGRAIES